MPRVTAFEAIDRCADPAGASHLVDRLRARDPESAARLDEDHRLLHRLAAVGSAGPYLGRICLSRAGALDVLADLDRPVRVGSGGGEELSGLAGMADAAGVASGVAEAKDLELLRIAARDLLGLDDLDAVVDQLSRLADGVLEAACAAGAPGGDLAVVAMGKLGARELNYASDIDLVLVGRGDQRAMLPLARAVLRVARAGWRVDLGLRPEGRSGPLVRSLDSYVAYWDRWARTWEFQALLKARWAAGDPDLGADWYEEACRRVWSRPFGAGEVRDVRDLKRRAEAEVARRGLTHREVKAGRGGIRDVEWAVQLLQMVHGRADPSLRVGGTVPALLALAAGGYVAQADADALAGSYRWLRTVEHRLQLVEGQPAHAVPATGAARTHLARTLGYRDRGPHSAAAQFDAELRFHQATVRSRHERLFFRPLLEAFTRPAVRPVLEPAAAEERLAAFGFSDAARTRQAVRELTAGFTRASRLWQQLLPLVLEWLSESPDPDLGLLGLRALADQHAGDQVIAVVRESAEAARQLCLFLGTGAGFTRDLLRHPDLLRRPDFLAPPGRQGPALGLRPRGGAGNAALGGAAGEARGGAGGGARGGAGGGARGGAGGGAHGGAGGRAEAAVGAAGGSGELAGRARQSLAWRQGLRSRQEGLQAFRRSEELCIAAHDVLGGVGVDDTGRDLTALAEAVLVAAVQVVGGAETLAVIAMGRLGGRELSYASDLDLLLVHDLGDSQAAASARTAAQGLLQVLNGETPAMRVYNVDTSLRPEGRQGPVARSLQSYETYYRRWAQTWERQALLRGRFVAGHAEIGERFASLATAFVWDRPLTDDDRRAIRRTKARIERERIPAGEDPRFHLKLGRGSLSDIEWTTQLLQLDHAVAATGTLDALRHLEAVGALDADDGAVLADAFRFCQLARNRLTLVRGTPADALPATGPHLHALARSLGTSATGLREEYRRVTRRSRRVVERLFYGQH